ARRRGQGHLPLHRARQQPRPAMEPQRRHQRHRRHPQRRRQCARDDAASREPRGAVDGQHRRPWPVRGARAAPRPSGLMSRSSVRVPITPHSCGRRSFATTAGRRACARARPEPAMPIAIVLFLINAILIVHAAKTGRFSPWAYLILLLPGVGALAYILVELLPEWLGGVQGQKARKHVINTLDPEKQYRKLADGLAISDTIANRVDPAQEWLLPGKFEAARTPH